MTDFSIGLFEKKEHRFINFEEFAAIVKGRSIVSSTLSRENTLYLDLSGEITARFFRTADGTEINLISTTNPETTSAIVIALGDMPSRVPVSVIERKLRGLRTLYAIYYLVQIGRIDDLTHYMQRHPYGDIEARLLRREEALFIETISPGSWLLTVWAKSKAAYSAISSVVGLVYERGRESFLQKREAEARLLKAKAEREELAVVAEEFDLKKRQIDYLLDVSDRVDMPEVREVIKKRMIQAAKQVSLGDRKESNSYKQLKNGEK